MFSWQNTRIVEAREPHGDTPRRLSKNKCIHKVKVKGEYYA